MKLRNNIKASEWATFIGILIGAGIVIYAWVSGCKDDFSTCLPKLNNVITEVEKVEEYGEDHIWQSGTGENLFLTGTDDTAKN